MILIPLLMLIRCTCPFWCAPRKGKQVCAIQEGFDGYLILKGMVQMGSTPSIIMRESKVLCFEDTDYQLKFIDWLSFLTMRLSAMPKALGYTDQTKGYFPHNSRVVFFTPVPIALSPLTGALHEGLHRATKKKIQMLKSAYGVQVSVIRGHEWNDMKNSHPEAKQFLRHNFPEHLSP